MSNKGIYNINILFFLKIWNREEVKTAEEKRTKKEGESAAVICPGIKRSEVGQSEKYGKTEKYGGEKGQQKILCPLRPHEETRGKKENRWA